MVSEDQINRLIEEHPRMVASYAQVAARILRAIKVQLHRDGYHGEASVVGNYAADLEMLEVSAQELTARSIYEYGESQCTPLRRRFRVVN